MKTSMNRRAFCARVGGSLALGALPASIASAACAQAENTLVVLFLRGGADGLSLVIPRGDQTNYAARRGSLAIPEGGSDLELDGFFELHPSIGSFKPLFDSGEMAMVHAMGGANDYSHFTAQDSIERVVPGSASQVTTDGWLNRALNAMAAQGDLCAPNPIVNGVSIGSFMTKALAGPSTPYSVAFADIASVAYGGAFSGRRASALSEIYDAQGGLAGIAGQAAFGAVDTLAGIANQPPGATYPPGNGRLNRALQDAARLIKNPDLGVRMITVNHGGWDHHSNLLVNIQNRGEDLASAVTSFWQDIGAARNRTCLLIVTEFGRTAEVNGNGGTDHGWGNAMVALSGAVAGGRVLSRGDASAPGSGMNTPSGAWPGLAVDELHVQASSGQPRDLKSTTDYRDVFGEVLTRFMGVPEAAVSGEVLRGYTPQYPGLFV